MNEATSVSVVEQREYLGSGHYYLKEFHGVLHIKGWFLLPGTELAVRCKDYVPITKTMEYERG